MDNQVTETDNASILILNFEKQTKNKDLKKRAELIVKYVDEQRKKT